MMKMKEELIEHVKKFPILYDQSEKDYRNKNVRNEAWEEIGGLLEISDNLHLFTYLLQRIGRLIYLINISNAHKHIYKFSVSFKF